MTKRQIALIVLDGWGYREDTKDNAIAMAKKPFFDYLWNSYPHTTLSASGVSVGLPDGQIGNSETGHMIIGAGRIVDEDLVRINKAINTSEFKENESFKKLFDHVKNYDSTLHVVGMVSPGGIHSHINHLFAFLDLAKEKGIRKIAIHAITDGRDTSPQSGAGYMRELEDKLRKLGVGEISSVSGRLYEMDRDKRWERIDLALEGTFYGKGPLCNIKASDYIENLYKENKNESDEYLKPFVCLNKEGNTYKLEKNDGFFFFNFRADRMRQITSRVLEKIKDHNLFLVTMTDYGNDYKCPIVFSPIKIHTTLGEIISENNLTQVHIAETEKFAHATYFLNCGEEKPYKGEEQILIQSPKGVLTYDLAPKMSAEKIADTAIEKIIEGIDFIFINFANADMVGHTANVPSIIIAIEEVDKELKRVIEALVDRGGIACITADHGNAEINIDPITGARHTAHTNDKVPFIITEKEKVLKEDGSLANIAPTILELYDIEKPEEMTDSLII